jgi:putative Holliday junction resolvase
MKIVNVATFKQIFMSSSVNVKIAALDIGTKCIGVALADETKTSITPFGDVIRPTERMSVVSLQKLSMQLQNMVNEQNVGGFVVGFPLLENGSLTPLCYEIVEIMTALQFKQRSSAFIPEPEILCTFWDERNSTVGARRMARSITIKPSVKAKFKDSFAACLILKGFVNHN